jgi:putative heme transporter
MVPSAPATTRIRVEFTPKTALVVTVALAAVWLVVNLLAVLLVIVVGLMIVGMLGPMVEYLEKRRWPRSAAIAVVFGGIGLGAVGAAGLTLPHLLSQLWKLVDQLPQMQASLANYLQHVKWATPLAQIVHQTRVPELMANAARVALSYSPQIAEMVGLSVSAIFLALYLLIDRDRMRGGLFALVPRHFHVRLSRIVLGLETIVGGYMRGQIITSALMAALTFALLAVAGVPNALALAVFAGLVDVLPYVGALLACGPAVIAALARGPTTALVVLVVLVAYQEFESRVIVPRVYGNVLRLPAAIVIIALLVGGKLLGILGALLALPIAAGIRMITEELRFELPGESPEDPALLALEERKEEEYLERAEGVPAEQAAQIAAEIAITKLTDEPAPR